MQSVVVQHRQFRLRLSAYAPNALRLLKEFLEHLPEGVALSDQETTWHLHMVMADHLSSQGDFASQAGSWSQWAARLHQVWAELEPTWREAFLCEVLSGHPDRQAVEFVYLIPRTQTPAEVYWMLRNYVFRLERKWLIQKGWILVHGAAVARRGRGFLFLGESGAGKTTLAKMSLGNDNVVLHDDRVLVKLEEDKSLVICAPGLSRGVLQSADHTHHSTVLLTGNPCLNSDFETTLEAVFVLKKDRVDYMKPLSKLSAACALVRGFLDASADFVSSTEVVKHSMQSLCTTARRVPAYELHFRKSPDFWKRIDEQFPG